MFVSKLSKIPLIFEKLFNKFRVQYFFTLQISKLTMLSFSKDMADQGKNNFYN